MLRLILVLVFSAASLLTVGFAAETGSQPVAPPQFDSAEQEARYWRLSQELRCLVCQGQSIADSNADLAVDLRQQVRRMIVAGRSDQEIIDYMTARYGDFILFRPPMRVSTLLLWFGPLLLLLLGAFFMLRRIRARAAAGRSELSAEEQRRARQLLGEDEQP